MDPNDWRPCAAHPIHSAYPTANCTTTSSCYLPRFRFSPNIRAAHPETHTKTHTLDAPNAPALSPLLPSSMHTPPAPACRAVWAALHSPHAHANVRPLIHLPPTPALLHTHTPSPRLPRRVGCAALPPCPRQRAAADAAGAAGAAGGRGPSWGGGAAAARTDRLRHAELPGATNGCYDTHPVLPSAVARSTTPRATRWGGGDSRGVRVCAGQRQWACRSASHHAGPQHVHLRCAVRGVHRALGTAPHAQTFPRLSILACREFPFSLPSVPGRPRYACPSCWWAPCSWHGTQGRRGQQQGQRQQQEGQVKSPAPCPPPCPPGCWLRCCRGRCTIATPCAYPCRWGGRGGVCVCWVGGDVY